MNDQERKMKWEQYLCDSRLYGSPSTQPGNRHPFEIDLDRIIFSSSFRRLKDKTQVHTLPKNDHVRNRLAHSLEVSSVGRSLGVEIGAIVTKKAGIQNIHPHHFGCVVQSACLAHDIGNPPFGHAGESAISEWFQEKKSDWWGDLQEDQKKDFCNFEGNAQGLRILSNIEMSRRKGGLGLTHSTLATFIKYPRSSSVEQTDCFAGSKKNGYFLSEEDVVQEVARSVGMIRYGKGLWRRHPLAFLVESADDICYSIIDIEDGYELGLISHKEAQEILGQIADAGCKQELTLLEQLRYLRATAIGKLIPKVCDMFAENEEAIIMGQYAPSLLHHIDGVSQAKELSRQRIFSSDYVVGKLVTGRRVIHSILNAFYDIVIKLHENEWNVDRLSYSDRSISYLLGRNELEIMRGKKTTRYDAIRFLIDYVSGMTDGFAIRLHRQINGIDC